MRTIVVALLVALSVPGVTAAQANSCHPITAEERSALILRGITIPFDGQFCDQDRQALFGGCESDPLPILLTQYPPAATSSESMREITELHPVFACRLSQYLTAFPGCIVRSGPPETEPTGTSTEPIIESHIVELCGLSEASQAALGQFGLYLRLDYEPWHVSAIGITAESGIVPLPPLGEFSTPGMSSADALAAVLSGILLPQSASGAPTLSLAELFAGATTGPLGAPATDGAIIALMLQVITLLQEYLRLLTAAA